MQYQIKEIEGLAVKTLYRLLLKNMKFYPSKNRYQLLQAVKEEFRDNQQLKDEQLIKVEIKKARIGLRHVLLYRDKNEELLTKNKIEDEGFVETINRKDKDFIYF